MNFINKIFNKKIDELVHMQFMKFSRGEFKNRAIIIAKHSKKNFNIATTAEFANELVRIAAEKLGEKTAKVTGGIITTNNLPEEIPYKSKKQFQGVKNYAIDAELSGKQIMNLL